MKVVYTEKAPAAIGPYSQAMILNGVSVSYTHLDVYKRQEFILQSGDLDNRRGTIDKDAMLKGSRLHRKLQKQMGGDYRAEVALRMNCSYEDLDIRLEGRADGIFTEDEVVWIDEIKGIYGNVEQMEEPVKVHKAQAMCYGYIYGVQEGLSKIGIQMTYANLETDCLLYTSKCGAV